MLTRAACSPTAIIKAKLLVIGDSGLPTHLPYPTVPFQFRAAGPLFERRHELILLLLVLR